MKFEYLIQKLLGVTEKTSRATGKNLSLPVLSCILLKTNKDTGILTLKATNLDIGVEFNIPVKNVESGSVAVPGSTLFNFLASAGVDGDIKVAEKDENLLLSFKNNTSTIKCFPKEDFPEIPSVSMEKKCRMPARDFVNGLKSVWFAASTSSIKPELSSVYIYPGSQELVFVATDSFRLAEKRLNYKNTIEFQPVLIPYKNIPDIIKILDGFNEELDIYFDKNQLQITFGAGKIVSRVIDGSFPDYKQIIPKELRTEATILKQDLIKAIRSAQVFSDNFNQIRFKFEGKANKFSLSTKNNEVGDYNETLQSKVTGDDLEISFNYKYILDSLQSIDAESIHFSLAGTGKPMIISGTSDKSFTYIAMPMNK
jgi:DNA polymerase III subunit beta